MAKKPKGMDWKIANHEFQEFRGDYPRLNETAAFELFTAYCCIKSYSHDSAAFENGRIGGSADGGIDWLYISINGQILDIDAELDYSQINKSTEIDVLVGQSKYQSTYSEDVGTKLFRTFSDLWIDPYNTETSYSQSLRERVASFLSLWIAAAAKRPTLKFCIFYCCMGELSPHDRVLASMDHALSPLRDQFPEHEIEQRTIGARELFDLYSKVPSYDRDLKYQEELDAKTGKVALVRLSDYYNFLCDDTGGINGHYFEDNVRDYQGKVSVNKEIDEELRSQSMGVDFWWLNNGITMLVSQAPVSRQKIYSLSDVRIVNGLQTSYSIFEYFKAHPSLVGHDDRLVLVRILAPDEESEKASIIRATNSQTAVNAASLRATGEVHIRIESALKTIGLYYDRRKNYYKNVGRSAKEIVSIVSMSQALISIYLKRPDSARARPSTLLKDGKIYKELFEGRAMEDFMWAAKMLKVVEESLQGWEEMSRSERNNIKFYVLLASRVLGAMQGPEDNRWDILGCNNNWYPDEVQLDNLVDWIYETAYKLVDEDEDSSLDLVCKGPELLNELEQNWANDQDLRERCGERAGID